MGGPEMVPHTYGPIFTAPDPCTVMRLPFKLDSGVVGVSGTPLIVMVPAEPSPASGAAPLMLKLNGAP